MTIGRRSRNGCEDFERHRGCSSKEPGSEDSLGIAGTYCLGEWWVCERMPVASTDMKVGGCLSYARSIGNARPAQAFIFVISKTVIREF